MTSFDKNVIQQTFRGMVLWTLNADNSVQKTTFEENEKYFFETLDKANEFYNNVTKH